MSAPCRSSKARVPAAVDPDAPGRALGIRPVLEASSPTLLSLKTAPAASEALAQSLLAPGGRRSHPQTSLKRRNGPWPLAGTVPLCQPRPAMRGASLLDLDLSPSLFQSRLDLLRLFLADAFFDRLRRSFDQVLGFLQAERGDGAHFLDHFDLFVADRREDDRKLGLLLDRRGGCTSGRSSGDRHRSGGRDAPLAFKQFGELRGLQDRKAREFVDDFFEIGH